MARILLILLGVILAVAPAAAKDDAAVCDGKYELAQEMLDAAYGKYGTLYSGGFEGTWSGNGVGPTIDLWRLWRGLPDLRFRDARQPEGSWGRDFSSFGRTSENMAMLLRIAERKKATGVSDVYRYVTAVYLNKLVSAGSGPWWWLAPGPQDQTQHQALVVESVAPGGLLEWLLVMMADSDRPDAVAWGREHPWATSADYPWPLVPPQAALREMVTARAKGSKSLEWQVAALVTEGSTSAGQTVLSEGITDCSATAAEYAAGAVEIYEKLKREGQWTRVDLDLLRVLPEKMRQNALANLAMLAVEGSRSQDNLPVMRERLQDIAAMSPSSDFDAWLYVGRAWTAETVEELIAFHDGGRLDQRAVDTLNLLGLEDLAAYADQVTLPDTQHRMLVQVVATRAFVLGRQDMARRYLTALSGLMPDYAPRISEALEGPGSDEVQVARAILALPRPTVRFFAYEDEEQAYIAGRSWRSFDDIDLPLRYVSAAVLNWSLRSWMEAPLFPNWYGTVRRADRRGRVYVDAWAQPFLPEVWQREDGYAFLRLVAWDELGQLDVCHGLTNRLSEVLTGWVDRNSDSWLDRLVMDEAALADTLQRLVVLNRRSPGALVQGRPAGQAAKALLETRFAATKAAEATPYWYFVDKGCRN